jgi:hypothetical protein
MALSMADSPDVFTLSSSVFQVPVRALPLSALGINVYLLEITPDFARSALERKNINRTIRLSQIRKIIRTLEQDRWEINGETIIFDADGRLIEGQHRLKAVAETGITMWSMVVTGIDWEWFKTMGQGSKRNAGDILGIRGVKNARNLAAALRWVYRYENGMMLNPHPNITDDELADTLPDHPGIEDSLPFGIQAHSVAAPGMVTALHYLCHKRNAGLANHFFHAFADGEDLSKGEPILVLRKRFVQELGKKRTAYILRDEQKAPMIVKAWNIMRKTPQRLLKNASSIAWHGREGEEFPKIL